MNTVVANLNTDDFCLAHYAKVWTM